MNLLLLCHGRLQEFGSFVLERAQEVQYRGNFGSNLGYEAAGEIVRALLDDPTISDERLARGFRGHYDPQPTLEGPGGFAPNIDLSGDDELPCFLLNLSTGRWCNLCSDWRTNLGTLCGSINGPLWLNLLCCTNIDDVRVPRLDPRLRYTAWPEVLK